MGAPGVLEVQFIGDFCITVADLVTERHTGRLSEPVYITHPSKPRSKSPPAGNRSPSSQSYPSSLLKLFDLQAVNILNTKILFSPTPWYYELNSGPLHRTTSPVLFIFDFETQSHYVPKVELELPTPLPNTHRMLGSQHEALHMVNLFFFISLLHLTGYTSEIR